MQIIARDRALYRKINSVRKFQVARDGCCAVSKMGAARSSENLSSVVRAAYASARIYESANFAKIEFAKREFVKFKNEAKCRLVRARRVCPHRLAKRAPKLIKRNFKR